MRTVAEEHFDHSGGMQGATSWLLRAQNEVEDVANARLDDEIGVITRRNGYVQDGDTLESGKDGLGLHEAKFSTGAKILAAINNSGDTETVIKHLTGSTWANLTLPGAVDPNTQINFCDSLDDAYAAGIDDSGQRMDILNIKNDLSVSATRNLIGAPKARFICEYGGSLYAMNVELDSEVYADRVYKSSPALSVITFTRGAQITTSNDVLAVDSVRYLKAGMAIDIYNHLTDTVRYSNVTIQSVDKAEDTIELPTRSGGLTFTTGNVNTTTDVITLSSTTNYPTGTPVVFTSTGAVPTGLTADVVYYVINISGTTIKVAASAAAATAGTALDLTAAGSGTHSIHLTYEVGDNDEIYLTGRHGELYYMWNTDYPTTDKAAYFKLPSGSASNSAIVGYGKSNNRLFVYTDGSTHRWDGQQLITIFEDIGCANHETIVEIGDWLIWLDSETRVMARNDSTGQKEFISRAIRKKWLRYVPNTNYAVCAAGREDNIYKLHLGTVNGSILRFCYDFDANNWARETHTRNYLQHVVSDKSGYKKLYFLDDTGKMFVDNTGNLDDTATIPFSVKYGRNNSGTIMSKTYSGWWVIGQNLAGLKANVTVNGQPTPIEIPVKVYDNNYAELEVGNKTVAGRDINLHLSHNGKGDPIAIEGYVPFLAAEERNFG
jgi:hypothetical protein